MFDKLFNRKKRDKNKEMEEYQQHKKAVENIKIPKIEDDNNNKKEEVVQETKKFKFSNEQISMFSSNNDLIKKEIFKINTSFTKVIEAIDKKLHAENYNINYGDIRTIYEELINLTIMKFMTSSQMAKNIYTTNNDLKNKQLNNKPESNRCIIDFNEGLIYDDDPISKYMSILEFRDYMKEVDTSIDAINTCMNNICNIEANVGLRELNKNEFNINEYSLLFNQQIFENLSKLMAISNMCKTTFIKNSIKNYTEAQKIK